MSWRSRPEAWTLALAVAVAAAPERGAAQGWRETQVWGAALTSDPGVLVGGVGLAWRDRGRTRLGGALGGGFTDDYRTAGRLEVAWHFLLDPARRTGLSVYGGGGLALGAIEGEGVTPYVQLVVGVETGSSDRNGMFVEGGFGGGLRLAAGFRVRTRRAPAR